MPATVMKICPQCDSQYELKEIPIPMRDKDSLLCDVCETTLISWNGGEMWASKLIKKGTTAKERK